MNGKVHAATGVIFGISSAIILSYFGKDLSPVSYEGLLSESIAKNVLVGDVVKGGAFVVSSWVGSLLPDIDHPTSTFSKKFSILSIPYRILQFIFGKFKCTKDFVGHRGITHSLFFMAIPVIIAVLITNPWLKIIMYGLSLGIFSHLFMDMLNPSGVPLFLPLSKRKFRLLPKKMCIKT